MESQKGPDVCRFEEHDGQIFLVMELVGGETLAERIAAGPIPVNEAVALFVQIAEGLESAHDKGIIHRDLKPANIKIDSDGKPKILDFGLAKAFVPEGGGAMETSQSPTLTKGTALGAIMGTAGDTSPEQARGKAVDKRTDVWAFGCCFCEALTARKAFDGETTTDIWTAGESLQTAAGSPMSPTSPAAAVVPKKSFRAVGGADYDVMPDGRSFIVITDLEGDSNPTELVLVQNFAAELERLVPTDNR